MGGAGKFPARAGFKSLLTPAFRSEKHILSCIVVQPAVNYPLSTINSLCIVRRQPAINYQLSTINYLLYCPASARYHLSTINYQLSPVLSGVSPLSTINCQLSTISCIVWRQPAINYQLSIVNPPRRTGYQLHRPAQANYQSSSVNYQLSIINYHLSISLRHCKQDFNCIVWRQPIINCQLSTINFSPPLPPYYPPCHNTTATFL